MRRLKLSEFKKLRTKATAGPLKYSDHKDRDDVWGTFSVHNDQQHTTFLITDAENVDDAGEGSLILSKIDAQYIAASHNIMPKLLAAIDEYKRFKETMSGINQHMGYQFTQPIINGTKALAALEREVE